MAIQGIKVGDSIKSNMLKSNGGYLEWDVLSVSAESANVRQPQTFEMREVFLCTIFERSHKGFIPGGGDLNEIDKKRFQRYQRPKGTAKYHYTPRK